MGQCIKLDTLQVSYAPCNPLPLTRIVRTLARSSRNPASHVGVKISAIDLRHSFLQHPLMTIPRFFKLVPYDLFVDEDAHSLTTSLSLLFGFFTEALTFLSHNSCMYILSTWTPICTLMDSSKSAARATPHLMYYKN